MSTANNKSIIIAAIASRPYVAAAVAAGYDVVAIDAFADCDLQQMATACYQVDVENGQLNSVQLLAALNGLDLSRYIGFCYGAGFEKTAEVLAKIRQKVSVLGNTESVIELCTSPKCFFTLCDELAIPYPTVTYIPPVESQGWLVKAIGASGGAHIKHLMNQPQESADVYYQQEQLGKSISCLFLSGQQGVQIIGFNEQWSDKDVGAPFRYGGAVSQAELSGSVKAKLTRYVEKLSAEMGLIGLNSCDVICDGDEVYVLEINPRLSATVDLHSHLPLMDLHISACQYPSKSKTMSTPKGSQAHQVLYARHDFVLEEGFNWPDWACDIPTGGASFTAGSPVCTVVANAKSALLAKQLVGERALALSDTLLN